MSQYEAGLAARLTAKGRRCFTYTRSCEESEARAVSKMMSVSFLCLFGGCCVSAHSVHLQEGDRARQEEDKEEEEAPQAAWRE